MSQTEKSSDFGTGAVRSADANHLDFTAIPILGLFGVARTTTEGGTKYGRYNYMQGMPVHDTLNHCIRHIFMYLAGDRSEPHLQHAGWGVLNAAQESILNPGLSAPHLLGPGMTLTPEVQAHLDANKADLAAQRAAGEFAHIGEWCMHDLPEVQTLLAQRAKIRDEDAFVKEMREIEREHIANGLRNAKASRPRARLKKVAKKSRKPTRPNCDDTWGEVVNHSISKYVAGMKDRTERNARIAKSLGLIRDTSAMVFEGEGEGEGQKLMEAFEDQAIKQVFSDPAPKPLPLQRFRAVHPRTGEQRIVKGRIAINNGYAVDGIHEFERVLIVGRPEHEYALMSPDLSPKRVLVVQEADWEAGEPYSIDPGWGLGDVREISNRVTGEVTRTERIDCVTGYPMPPAKPVGDEWHENFRVYGVRVYFKKPA